MNYFRQEPDIWKENYNIRSYEVDAGGNLSILSLCNFMQDAAGKNARALRISSKELHPRNYTWVLSRMALRMDAYPRWKDQLQIQTWPSGVRRLFSLRDFFFADQENRCIGACVSAWLVMDTNTRRLVRMEPFIGKLKPADREHVLTNKLNKLPKLKNHDYTQRFTVSYTDLDTNAHVNNVSYIEWMMKSLPVAVQSTGMLSELEINFTTEALLEDCVIAACQSQDKNSTTFLHSIVREEDAQELVRARTVWKETSQKGMVSD